MSIRYHLIYTTAALSYFGYHQNEALNALTKEDFSNQWHRRHQDWWSWWPSPFHRNHRSVCPAFALSLRCQSVAEKVRIRCQLKLPSSTGASIRSPTLSMKLGAKGECFSCVSCLQEPWTKMKDLEHLYLNISRALFLLESSVKWRCWFEGDWSRARIERLNIPVTKNATGTKLCHYWPMVSYRRATVFPDTAWWPVDLNRTDQKLNL